MLIGELSKLTGVSRDTIRWYEKVGLLQVDYAARSTNNYRLYDHRAVADLLMIKQSKSFGFSLEEIKEILELVRSNALDCEAMTPMIEDKLDLIEERIVLLQEMKARLVKVTEQCTGDCQQQILQN
ncbi:MAG: MerR family transcriptional regulator [Bacteroidota bacterium]